MDLEIAPSSSLLVIVDVQQDFISGGVLEKEFPGFFDKKHPDIPDREELLENLSSFIEFGEQIGLKRIYIQSDYSCLNPALERKFQQDGVAGKLCQLGTEGYNIPSIIAPKKNDIVVSKSSHSSFIETNLHETIQTKFPSVDTLIISGVEGNVCVESTLRDASAYGYNVIVIKELVSSSEVQMHFNMLENCKKYFGYVVNLETIKQQLLDVKC